MTIHEIYKRGEMSIRSYNICKSYKFNNLNDLKEYYLNYNTFLNLKNCGERSNKELIYICNKYEKYEIKKVEYNDITNIISSLSRLQREIINSFIIINTNNLSVRSKNAISLYLKNNLSIRNFGNNIFTSKNFDVLSLPSVGKQSAIELIDFISIIKDFILKVSQTDNEKHLIRLKNSFLIQRTFDIPLIPEDILESESIFQLTDFLLNQNSFFNEVQTFICKKVLKLYTNQIELSLDDIAQEVKLSKERVRQIKSTTIERLSGILPFISNFNDDIFQKYNIDSDLDYIDINTEIVKKINHFSKTNLSIEFITFIVSIYLKNKFELVGNLKDVLEYGNSKSSNRHNWISLHIVSKELISEFNFISFANDISKRLNERIDNSYSFNFKSYISNFLTKNNYKILVLLFPICEKIINKEFNLYLDLNENINFTRNTFRQVHEYAFEALEHLNKQSSVDEILKKVNELYPNYETNESRIRVSMKRKNGFIPIGRTSVFGLKKWEYELDNFRGGTIREITRKYLSSKQNPIHIIELSKHILKFRPKTNINSILSNLKADESSEFVFFPQSFVGLSTKMNNYDIEKYNKLPTQLGKKIVSMSKKGLSKTSIIHLLESYYKLDQNESMNIIDNLNHFQ